MGFHVLFLIAYLTKSSLRMDGALIVLNTQNQIKKIKLVEWTHATNSKYLSLMALVNYVVLTKKHPIMEENVLIFLMVTADRESAFSKMDPASNVLTLNVLRTMGLDVEPMCVLTDRLLKLMEHVRIAPFSQDLKTMLLTALPIFVMACQIMKMEAASSQIKTSNR